MARKYGLSSEFIGPAFRAAMRKRVLPQKAFSLERAEGWTPAELAELLAVKLSPGLGSHIRMVR